MRYWSGREDLNLRPPEPHSGALPGCATPRVIIMLSGIVIPTVVGPVIIP